MIANATKINGGREVRMVTDRLSDYYHTYQKVIRVRDHGDESNRERLFIVGIHRRLGNTQFQWPEGDVMSQVTARYIAQPDHEVPDRFWRHIKATPFDNVPTTPGRLNKIAQLAPGMGHSRLPHSIYSWDGTMNTGTTHNGGGMRPTLKWCPGMPLRLARKTTPIEAARVASLPDDYIDLIGAIDRSDQFAYECINMGVPVGTATAINTAITHTLNKAGVVKTTNEDIQHMREQCRPENAQWTTDSTDYMERDRVRHEDIHDKSCTPGDRQCPDKHITLGAACCNATNAVYEGIRSAIRSIQVDTGTDMSLVGTEQDPNLVNTRKANIEILVADSSASMPARWLGDLPCIVLNTSGAKGIHQAKPERIDWEIPDTLTVPRVRRDLMSIEKFYRTMGYEMFIRQPENGPSELTNVGTGGNVSIPIRHDPVKGGFWIDYIPMQDVNDRPSHMTEDEYIQQQFELLKQSHEKKTMQGSKQTTDCQHANMMTNEMTDAVMKRCANNAMVQEIIYTTVENTDGGEDTVKLVKTKPMTPIYAQHPDERQWRGIKNDLKKAKRDMKEVDFHETHGHIGCVKGGLCKICRMVKGSMRRIYKIMHPYRPQVPGFAWTMDMITFSDRSEEGWKYLCVLRDRSTEMIQTLPLANKSDAWSQVAQWIRTLRQDPLYKDQAHPIVGHITTDMDGSWRHDNAEWQKQICDKLSVEMQYISPDRHEQNGAAERACGIVECVTKALLMQNNLSPKWWGKAQRDAEFLLNRFPTSSSGVAVSMDGDRQRPIEIFTNGRYGRQQVNREINYYVPVGTPCLVHDHHAMGSTVGPKVRWGIASSMHREVPEFLCPFANTTFRSKSYVACKQAEGRTHLCTILGYNTKTNFITTQRSHIWQRRKQRRSKEGS